MSQSERSTPAADPALTALAKAAEEAGFDKEDIAVESVAKTPGMYFLRVRGDRKQRGGLETTVLAEGTRLEVTGVHTEDGATVLTYQAAR